MVEHEVLLKTNFTPEYKEVFSKVTQQVTEKIQEVTTEQISKNNTCLSKFLGREGAAGRGPGGSLGGSVLGGPGLWEGEQKHGLGCRALLERPEWCGGLGGGARGRRHGEGAGPLEGHCSGEQGSRLSFPCAGPSYSFAPRSAAPTKGICFKGLYVFPSTGILCYNNTATKVQNLIVDYNPESR